jgi:hypothetical protein
MKILKERDGLTSSKLENRFILLTRRPLERSLSDKKQKNRPIMIKM